LTCRELNLDVKGVRVLANREVGCPVFLNNLVKSVFHGLSSEFGQIGM